MDTDASTPTIRLARPSDAAAIAVAHVAAWRSAYRGILPQAFLDALSVERRAEMWSTILSRGEAIVLVAERDARIVGFASAGPAREGDVDRERVGEIAAIYLLEEVWSTGLGHRLFDDACARLRDRGFAEIVLRVLEHNDRARRFYERMGMTAEDAPAAVLSVDGTDHREIRYRTSVAPRNDRTSGTEDHRPAHH